MNPEAKNKPRDICPVKKGYGMSVVSMNPFNCASLYSVADKIGKIIPATLDESRAKQMAWQAKFGVCLLCFIFQPMKKFF